MAAELQYFTLKGLHRVPKKAVVLEAGLFMGAPAPEAAEGVWVMLWAVTGMGESKEGGF